MYTNKQQREINIVLKNFDTFVDTSIRCYDNNKDNIEFVLFGTIKDDKLSTIEDDIKTIVEIQNYCLNYSCGLHIHISSDDIPYNYIGIIFLIDLLLKWVTTEQNIFMNKFAYQTTITKGKYSYSKPNKLKEENIKQLLDIREKMFYINNNAIDVRNIIIILIKINNLYSSRPFLTIIDDEETIHVEFRGLLPYNVYKTIELFVQEIKKMYTNIMQDLILTIEEMAEKMD